MLDKCCLNSTICEDSMEAKLTPVSIESVTRWIFAFDPNLIGPPFHNGLGMHRGNDRRNRDSNRFNIILARDRRVCSLTTKQLVASYSHRPQHPHHPVVFCTRQSQRSLSTFCLIMTNHAYKYVLNHLVHHQISVQAYPLRWLHSDKFELVVYYCKFWRQQLMTDVEWSLATTVILEWKPWISWRLYFLKLVW